MAEERHYRRAEDGLEGRLSRTEAHVDSLAASVGNLARSMEQGFKSVNDRLDAAGKPQYGLLLQLIAVLTTIGVLAGAPVWMQISEAKSRLDDFRTWRLETAYALGEREAMIERNTKDLRELRDDLTKHAEWTTSAAQEVVAVNERQSALLEALSARADRMQ